MILTAASPTSVHAASANPAGLPNSPHKVGELAASWRRDESLYVGNEIAPAFSTLDAALSGAAGLAQDSGYAVAVTRSGDGFRAQELLQPVWKQSFGRESAYSLAPAQIEVIGSQVTPGDAKFGFYSYRTDGYGGQDNRQRTGTIKLDAAAGVEAIVGGGWAFVDGQLRSVEATRPNRPDPTPVPTPPIDPKPPVDPPSQPTGRTTVEDVTEAVRLARESARIIGEVPTSDKGDESTKATRIKAYKTNMAAQERLERQFTTSSQEVVSKLRAADASLEDANWQLAKKPSPDGRFNGVDIPGALRDTQTAVTLLDELLSSLVQSKAA